jgi:hypothetical protein
MPPPPGDCPLDAATCGGDPPCPPTGCLALDESGRGNHGVLDPGARYAPGRFGNALALPCISSSEGALLTGPAVGFPSGTQTFTIEAWVQNASNRADVLATVTAALEIPWSLAIRRVDGFGRLHLDSDSGTICATNDSRVVDGRLHLVAVTYDGWTVRLFVDGDEIRSCVGVVLSDEAASSFRIGVSGTLVGCARLPLPTLFRIDELRLLDEARSPLEIATTVVEGRLAPTASTVGLWHFDEGGTPTCCASDTTCGPENECIRASGPPTMCATGSDVQCESVCCPAGSSCGPDGTCVRPVAPSSGCPGSAPVACGAVCCPEDTLCHPEGCATPPCPPLEVCGSDGDVCACGRVCSDPERRLCCPAASPILCADGERCVDEATDCGIMCPGGPETLCGTSCCAPGAACVDGACQCPPDHPAQCGDLCCLAGASCDGSACGCPGSRVACGDLSMPVTAGIICCAAGEVCSDGTCTEPTTPGDGCPAICTEGQPCGACNAGQIVCDGKCCYSDSCSEPCWDAPGSSTVFGDYLTWECDGDTFTVPCGGGCCATCLVCDPDRGSPYCVIPSR